MCSYDSLDYLDSRSVFFFYVYKIIQYNIISWFPFSTYEHVNKYASSMISIERSCALEWIWPSIFGAYIYLFFVIYAVVVYIFFFPLHSSHSSATSLQREIETTKKNSLKDFNTKQQTCFKIVRLLKYFPWIGCKCACKEVKKK